MNKILLIVLCLFPFSIYGQIDTIPEDTSSINFTELQMNADTCLTPQQIVKIAQTIKELKRRVNVQSNIIEALEDEVKSRKTLLAQNESIIALQNREIKIYEGITDRFQNLHMPQKRWFDSQEFNFIMGALVGGATIYLGAKMNQ